MILNGGKQNYSEKRLSRSEFCPIKNLICTGLGISPGLRGERPATNSLIHGKAKEKINLSRITFKDSFRTAQKTIFVIRRINKLMLHREITAVILWSVQHI
jgi:hypothetical protein